MATNKQHPQRNKNMFGKQSFPGQDETDFNSSCCDYNSDVFKEQPSYQGDDDCSKFEKDPRELMSGESPMDYEIRENPLVSPNLVSCSSHKKSQHSNFESEQKLRIHAAQNSERLYQPTFSNAGSGYQMSKIQRQNTSKVCSEQSLNTINTQPRGNGHQGSIQAISSQTGRHQKQPLYSMIPETVNKNLNSKIGKHNEENLYQVKVLDHISGSQMKGKQSATTILAQVDTNKRCGQNIMFCEETELMNNFSRQGLSSTKNQGSIVNLTPQKNKPIPISPTQKPNMTSCSSSQFNLNQGRGIPSMNQQLSTETKDRQKINLHGSAQKATVVYNEFKYYTHNNDVSALNNNKKFINISNTGVGGINRKSDIERNATSSALQNYEISPGENRIFEVSSPKLSLGTSNLNQASSNSNQKFRVTTHNYTNSMVESSNTHFQAITRSDNETQMITEQRFKELQSYVEQLENDLKVSMNRNDELKKRFKDRSFIQSFEKSKKHLSDTEDSLILSEKKGNKRASMTKLNSISNQNINSMNNEQQQQRTTVNQTQSTVSIVDVKIRPVSMMKITNCNLDPSPNKPNYLVTRNNSSQKKLDSDSEALDYQVQDFNDTSNSQVDQVPENEEELSHDNHNEEDCEGCERLKQLVFQAKEAIDDLKLEIEEWRDLCAEKDTELRQIHHKIYNDILGIDKKIEFNDEIQTKEFDSTRPVNADSKRIINFIKHNKKRIRSRSKNAKEGADKSIHKNRTTISICSSVKKKSSIKRTKEITSDEYELYEAEDQGVQTSFVFPNANNQDQSSQELINLKNSQPVAYSQTHYHSNQSTTHCLTVSPNALTDMKEQSNLSQIVKCSEETQIHDEIITLRAKTSIQDQEIMRLRTQINSLTKQCDQFVLITNKAKRKTKKQNFLLEINELKEHNEIISQLESYSILEKINEWKKEEGLVERSHDDGEGLPPTQIPRPIKLILDIEPNEIQEYAGLRGQNLQQLSQTSNDFLSIIRQEQDQLKKQQELKYLELQKQQQEYLNLLKGI